MSVWEEDCQKLMHFLGVEVIAKLRNDILNILSLSSGFMGRCKVWRNHSDHKKTGLEDCQIL